jgi:hypothetical protein
MNVGRTILALLIALSVAMLPTVASANIAVTSTDMTEMADMAAMEDMDCCPHKAKPCDHCSSMATCQLACFGFSATASSNVIFPRVTASLSPLSGANAFRSQIGSPPFRPPRV